MPGHIGAHLNTKVSKICEIHAGFMEIIGFTGAFNAVVEDGQDIGLTHHIVAHSEWTISICQMAADSKTFITNLKRKCTFDVSASRSLSYDMILILLNVLMFVITVTANLHWLLAVTRERLKVRKKD